MHVKRGIMITNYEQKLYTKCSQKNSPLFDTQETANIFMYMHTK